MLNFNRWIWKGNEFVECLIASQLADEEQTGLLVEEFRESDCSQPTITGFCDFLISKGVVTFWQCAKIRNGQFKGFFTGEYVILDYLSSNNTSSAFVARHVKTRDVVVLLFDPPSTTYRDVRPLPEWLVDSN